MWTSLEVVKLLVSALNPIALIFLAYNVNKRVKKIEDAQWRNQRLIEKRISFYSEVVPRLNDVFCFYAYVGRWKEMKPTEIIEAKRALDRQFYVNAPLFPAGVFSEYQKFSAFYYRTYTGWGEDAKLRTSCVRRKETWGELWNPDWDGCFAPNEALSPTIARQSYNSLVDSLANSLGLDVIDSSASENRLPGRTHRG